MKLSVNFDLANREKEHVIARRSEAPTWQSRGASGVPILSGTQQALRDCHGAVPLAMTCSIDKLKSFTRKEDPYVTCKDRRL